MSAPRPDLAAIRARARDATRGPWQVGVRWETDDGLSWLPINSPSSNEDEPHQPDRVAIIRYHAGGWRFPHHEAKADAEFIAHARTDIPALLAEVDRLEALLALAHDGYMPDPDAAAKAAAFPGFIDQSTLVVPIPTPGGDQ